MRTSVGILGASGQVGLSLLKHLNSMSQLTVVGICRSHLSATRVEHAGGQVLVLPSDRNEELTRTLSSFDVIVNCALPAQGPTRNAREAHRLAECLAGVGKRTSIVHLSSVAVYGSSFVRGRTKFDAPVPDDRYGREKLQMERLLWRMASRNGKDVWIFRLGHVYGPELNWSKIIFGLLSDPDFGLPFGGSKLSNAIYVNNIAAAISEVIANQSEPGIYNLFDHPQRTWREVFELHSRETIDGMTPLLSSAESDAIYERLAAATNTNILVRLSWDFARWLRTLPASFVANSPALQTLAERLLARSRSDRLEARLKAFYWRAVMRQRVDNTAVSGPIACIASDEIPGPSFPYRSVPFDPAELDCYRQLLSEPIALL